MLSAMQHPHWLMVAGAVLVVLGFIGFAFRQNKRVEHDLESTGNEGEGEMTMRVLIILAAICFSANAMAQAPSPPKGGHKPLVQVKPKAPEGCKLVGTVKGTKLWAGNCAAASELRGTTPTDEPAAPAPAPEANPPAAKQ